MHQSGLLEYWRKKFFPSVSYCDWTLSKTKPRKLNLGDVQSPFLILGLGLSLAFIAFITERLIFCIP